MKVDFEPRHDPLEPVCVVGIGAVGRALAHRLLATPDETLRGVATDDALLVLGPSASLPWVDGALYLGRDPEAPQLLLSTRERPSVPIDVFERAILRLARDPAPLAVLPTRRLVSVAAARVIEPAQLRAWLQGAA